MRRAMIKNYRGPRVGGSIPPPESASAPDRGSEGAGPGCGATLGRPRAAIAAHAPAIVGGPAARGGTQPLPVYEADRMRHAVAQAYAGAITPSAGPVS